MEVVKNNWKADFEGDPFILFHHKLKRVKKALTQWSKETFGNIFQEIVTLEEIIKVKETQFERFPTTENREILHRAQAELKKQLNREEEFWKQKAGMEWFKEGERNTKFFHTVVKGRRSRLRVNRIQNEEGDWLEQQSDIAEATVEFYVKQFTRQEDAKEEFGMLEELPRVITSNMNEEMEAMPTLEEVRRAVMGLNKNST